MKSANHIDDSPKGLRHFGITMAGIFTVLAYIMRKHENSALIWGSVILAALFLICLVKPQTLKIPQKLWMGLAFRMGKVMTKVLMTVLFYGLVTPLALFAKLFGQDFLRPKTQSKPKPGSYWTPSSITRDTKEDYLRQF